MIERFALGAAFFAVAAVLSALWFAAARSLARGARLAVLGYELGVGPTVARIGRARLHVWPRPPSLDPARRADAGDPDAEGARALGRVALDDAPLAIALGLLALGTALPFACAVALLGPEQAARATLRGLRGYVAGAGSPLSAGPHILALGLAALGGDGLAFAGKACAALAGVELLGLPVGVLQLLARHPRGALAGARTALRAIGRLMDLVWAVVFFAWAADG